MTAPEKNKLLSAIDRRIEITKHNMQGMPKTNPMFYRYDGEIEGYKRIREVVEMMPCTAEHMKHQISVDETQIWSSGGDFADNPTLDYAT